MLQGQSIDGELLERAQPLALLEALLADAATAAGPAGSAGTAGARAGSIALVTGEAGIGKTALVDRFLARLPAGTRCFVGGCEALQTPRPLGPVHDFAAALPPAVRGLLAEHGDRAALFVRLLEELAHGPGPALLVVEDVHWADAATLDLLKFLGRRLQRQPVLMLLTARDDPAARATVAPVLADLPSRCVTRIALPPLSLEAVRRLAGEGASGDEVRALHEVSGGVPFFVVEVLRDGGTHATVPTSVRDAVLARADALPRAQRELLEQASVFPRRLPVSVLQRLPVDLEGLDGCVAAGLLRVQEGEVRFRHELARVAVEEAIAPARACRLHSAALTALVVLPNDAPAGVSSPAAACGDADSAQLAHHAQRAWDPAAVARWAPLAARQAAARGALREAVAHGRAALQAGAVVTPPERAALLEDLGRHLFELNQLEASAAAYREAIGLCRVHGWVDAQVRCLASLAMPLVRLLRNREADEAARAALDLAAMVPGTPATAQAQATEAYLRMLNRDYLEAITAAQQAIALASEGDRATLARAYETLGAATLFLDYDRGCELLRHSMALARELPDGGAGVADAWLMLSTASGELYQLDAADAFLEEGMAFARSRDLDRQAAYMEAWAAVCDVHRGRWALAGERANRLLAREAQASTGRVMALVALGRLRTRRGDPGVDVEALLDEALDLAQRSGTLQRLAPVCLVRAEAAWLRRDLPGVLAEVERVEALARSKSHPWFVGELAYWRHAAGGGEVPRQGCAQPFRLQLEGRWEEAARAWRARGCPYEEARALAAGDEDAQRQALVLLDGLGAVPLARRVRDALHARGAKGVPRGPMQATRAHPAGLTRREVEVLQLLAQALRPSQIAVRLSRSVRTVDHHVESLYAKLGASSRSQALARAQALGLLGEK